MQKGNKRLLIAGSALIGIAVLLILYVALIGLGVINIRQQPLVIRAGTAEKAYDGTPLICEEWTLVQGTLKDGHTIMPLFTGSQTSPGQSENQVSVHIVDANGSDVTNEYRIEYLTGTLSVYNTRLAIETTNQTKFYDGYPLSAAESSWMLQSGSLMLGHELEVKLEATLTEVGTCDNTARVKVVDAAGNDVTGLYEITTTCGTLSVLARPLTVESATATKIYDGTPLVAEEVQIRSGSLMKGHQLKCVVTGSQTELGSSNNLFTVSVVNEKGEDVSSYYQITTVTGRLHVVEVYSAEDAENLSPEANSGINGSGGANSDANVLAIQTNVSGPAYLRLQSFAAYNTESFGWDVSPILTEDVCGFNPMYWIGSALLQSGEPLSTMSITWQVTPRGLLVPYYTQSDFATGVDDSYIALGSASYTVDYISFDMLETLVGRISSISLPAELYDGEEAYRAFVQENFLDIPTDQLREVMIRHMKEAGIKPTSKTIIQDVASYIQSAAVYNLDAPVPDDGVDPIIYFLDESKEGVCRHYASAAVMMYRALGIPARYVVGYLANAEADSLTMVTGMQAHAWVEVYINGLGWLPVEVTGGSSIPNGGVGTGAENKIQITARPVNVRGLANGTTYTATHFRIFGEMGENHEFSCTFGGSLSQPGTAASYITSYSIQDTLTGEDVTDLYEVMLEEGKIQVVDKSADLDKIVDPILLAIKPKDVKTPYTGLPITASEWEYVEGSDFLKENHDLVCSFGGERTDVGEEISTVLSYSVVDRNTGVDVTEQYEVICHEGLIEVEPPSLTLIIKPADVYGIADGTTWAPTSWELVEGSDNLLAGHTLRCKMAGSLDKFGKTNSLIEQYAIMDVSGQNVSSMYNVVLKQGTIWVQIPLAIKPVDVEAMFTGEEHGPKTTDDWEYAEGNGDWCLQEGHRFESITYEGSLTFPIRPEGDFGGDDDAYFEACKQSTRIVAYKIVNELGKDVSKWYRITSYEGYVMVMGLDFVVTPKNVQYQYNGEEQAASEYTLTPVSWFEGHQNWLDPYNVVVVLNGSRTDFGTTEIKVESVQVLDQQDRDMTQGFNIELKTGLLTVYAERLVFRTADVTKAYDGTPLTNPEYELIGGGLLDGHTLSVENTTSITQVGKVSNSGLKVSVLDQTGEDVSHWYYIDRENSQFGSLTVEKAKLEIHSNDATAPFVPGQTLTCHEYTIVSGSVAEGETIDVVITGQQSNPGKSQNFIRWEDVRIYRDGAETTGYYDIKVVAGWLTVTPPQA